MNEKKAFIKNPVLRGFHPDPSICRAGDDYYIATSTFEWYPGVKISHSKDLIHWKHISYALTRESQLEMRGTPDSTGVWAPCLSWSDGVFYLIYSNMKNRDRSKDVNNYLVTAKSVKGPWSEPVFLNSSGFDPSMFHDDDGRKWLVNMKWVPQPTENSFAGILLQEYDPVQKKLTGKCTNIFKGTSLGLTEAPHLYKRNGFYYLMTAEGGTGYEHAVTVARSRKIEGPYEVCPDNPILTSSGSPAEQFLQKAGHASLVETPGGQWYMAHLCGRPVPGTRQCPLGRETAIQRIIWTDDGWPRLRQKGKFPDTEVETEIQKAAGKEKADQCISEKDDFEKAELKEEWNTLRQPFDETRQSLSVRPGWLRIYGGMSLNSLFDQTMVARRVQAFSYTAETCMEFCPESVKQKAGLVCYYDTKNYLYLNVTWNEEKGCRCIGVECDRNGDIKESMLISDYICIPDKLPVKLKVTAHGYKLQFSYSIEKDVWNEIGTAFDEGMLSDEAAWNGDLSFTGTFTGMCCQDGMYGKIYADFDYFYYTENEK